MIEKYQAVGCVQDAIETLANWLEIASEPDIENFGELRADLFVARDYIQQAPDTSEMLADFAEIALLLAESASSDNRFNERERALGIADKYTKETN